MLRCELNVDDRLFPHSFLAYGNAPSTPLNLQPGLVTIALEPDLTGRIVDMGEHHTQRLTGLHHAVGATPHKALSCIAQR